MDIYEGGHLVVVVVVVVVCVCVCVGGYGGGVCSKYSNTAKKNNTIKNEKIPPHIYEKVGF